MVGEDRKYVAMRKFLKEIGCQVDEKAAPQRIYDELIYAISFVLKNQPMLVDVVKLFAGLESGVPHPAEYCAEEFRISTDFVQKILKISFNLLKEERCVFDFLLGNPYKFPDTYHDDIVDYAEIVNWKRFGITFEEAKPSRIETYSYNIHTIFKHMLGSCYLDAIKDNSMNAVIFSRGQIDRFQYLIRDNLAPNTSSFLLELMAGTDNVRWPIEATRTRSLLIETDVNLNCFYKDVLMRWYIESITDINRDTISGYKKHLSVLLSKKADLKDLSKAVYKVSECSIFIKNRDILLDDVEPSDFFARELYDINVDLENFKKEFALVS